MKNVAAPLPDAVPIFHRNHITDSGRLRTGLGLLKNRDPAGQIQLSLIPMKSLIDCQDFPIQIHVNDAFKNVDDDCFATLVQCF